MSLNVVFCTTGAKTLSALRNFFNIFSRTMLNYMDNSVCVQGKTTVKRAKCTKPCVCG